MLQLIINFTIFILVMATICAIVEILDIKLNESIKKMEPKYRKYFKGDIK